MNVYVVLYPGPKDVTVDTDSPDATGLETAVTFENGGPDIAELEAAATVNPDRPDATKPDTAVTGEPVTNAMGAEAGAGVADGTMTTGGQLGQTEVTVTGVLTP